MQWSMPESVEKMTEKVKTLKNRDLLIISQKYNFFIKDQVEELAPYFNSITVCVRYNIIGLFLSFLRFDEFREFAWGTHINISKIPDNVKVFPNYLIYFYPINYQNVCKMHERVVERCIRKNNVKFDIVHAHFAWSSGYVGAKIKEKYQVPFIMTVHGYDIYDLPFRSDTLKELMKKVFNTATRIITVSNKNISYFSKLDLFMPVEIIPNGFNELMFHLKDSATCKKQFGLPLNKKIIITVGFLDAIKGHCYLIDAMKIIVKKRDDVFCIIVGSGARRKSIEKQIRQNNLERFFILPGERPHHEIPDWINASDIFVLPSINEGNPTVMFEALACGKPFVGTDVGGIPEIIISEDYGLLVRPEDSKDLSEKILKALDTRWDSKKIANYAMQFTWQRICRNIVKVYEEVL